MSTLDFLNNNSGGLNALFSFVVAISTVVYAILTWQLVSETRRMRQAQQEPKVSVTIQPREDLLNFVDLIVENIGVGAAYNVNFQVDSDFEYGFTQGRLSDIGFIKKGINYFAPQQKIKLVIANMSENYAKQINRCFTIQVTYRDSLKKKYTDRYLIDFSEMHGLNQLGKPPLYEISQSLKKIEQYLNKISTGNSKVQVIAYTLADIEEEHRKLVEEYEKRISSVDKSESDLE